MQYLLHTGGQGYKIQLTDILEFLHIFIYGFMDNIIPWSGIYCLSLYVFGKCWEQTTIYEGIFANS
jgi:hypothetical protein